MLQSSKEHNRSAYHRKTAGHSPQLIGCLHFPHQLSQAQPNLHRQDSSISWRQRVHRLSSLVSYVFTQTSMWNLDAVLCYFAKKFGVCSYVEQISPPFPFAGSACCYSDISLAASWRAACNSLCIFDLSKVKAVPFIHELDRFVVFSSSISLTAYIRLKWREDHQHSIRSATLSMQNTHNNTEICSWLILWNSRGRQPGFNSWEARRSIRIVILYCLAKKKKKTLIINPGNWTKKFPYCAPETGNRFRGY